jgi:RNA recognition motif-containing protein
MATNPPCFAFVNFKHRDDAEEAMQGMDGKYVQLGYLQNNKY